MDDDGTKAAHAAVFISYRTDDTGETATSLHRELSRMLGEGRVFIDHRELAAAQAWTDQLRHAVTVLADSVLGWYRRHMAAHGVKDGHSGAVLALQRASANLRPSLTFVLARDAGDNLPVLPGRQ